jgi:hypothetical protein
MKIEVIEWEENGVGTNTYSPVIINGKNKTMFHEKGKPKFFYTKKAAREFAKDWILKQETKP